MSGPRWLCAFVLATGLVFHVVECNPLSSSGCACTSGCGKSWHGMSGEHSRFEWCSVDISCKSVGWDWCHDTEKLFKLVVDQKQQAEAKHLEEHQKHLEEHQKHLYEHKKREEAESQSSKLKEQLADAQKQIADINRKASDQAGRLAAEVSKELAIGKELSAAKRRDSDLKDKYLQKQIAEETKKTKDLEQKFENKWKEAKELELQKAKTEELLGETQLKLANMTQQFQAEDTIARSTQEKLGTTQEKLQHATEAMQRFMDKTKRQLAEAGRKQLETSEKLQKTELEVKDVTQNLHQAEQRNDELEKELKGSKVSQHDAETKMQEAEVKREAAELRTFRLAIRGAVRGGTGVVDRNGTVARWRIR